MRVDIIDAPHENPSFEIIGGREKMESITGHMVFAEHGAIMVGDVLEQYPCSKDGSYFAV